jgi:hypothetical protein
MTAPTWTPELEARAKDLLAKATPRPWRWARDRGVDDELVGADDSLVVWGCHDNACAADRDAAFIAAAPDLLASALAEIERLRGELLKPAAGWPAGMWP